MRRLLADRDFRLLFAAQTLTMFGDVALLIVLGIWVKSLTDSNGAAGSVFLVLSIPTLITPLVGPVIDRFPRRTVMVVNDLIIAAVILCLLFVDGESDVWIIYAVAFFYGAALVVFFAARSGLLVSMVAQDDLADANGLFESLRQALRIIGPLVGAALFAAVGGGAVAVLSALTLLASAVILMRLRVEADRPHERGDAMIREVTAGIRHIGRTPDVRRLVLYTAAVLTVIGMTEIAIFALIDEGLHRPPEFLGVISTVEGFGAVAGGLVAGRMMRRLGELRLAAVGLAGLGVGFGIQALATLSVVFAAAVVIGVAVAFFMVAYTTLIQRRTSPEMQGRVFTAAEAIINVPYILSIALGAALVGIVSFRWIYAVTGVTMVLGGLAMLRTRPEEVAPEIAVRVPVSRAPGETAPLRVALTADPPAGIEREP